MAATCHQGDGASDVPVGVAKRRRFVRAVEAEGNLRPVRSTPVALPPYVQGSFRVAWLADDGSVVKKGAPLVRLDDHELVKRLTDARSDRAIAVAEKRKEGVLLDAARQQRRRDIESAQRTLAFQRTFAAKDDLIFSRDQIIDDETSERLDATRVEIARKNQQAGTDLEKNRLGLSEVAEKTAADQILRADRERHALELIAPHDGVFTLRRDGDNETARVGDSMGRGFIVGAVSRVEEMEAEVFVLEAEAAGLADGRRAEVIIDAQPDRPYDAKIKSVDKVTKVRQSQSPTRYFGVTLALARTDPAAMKPEQRVLARLYLFDGEALVVPRPALFDRDGRWVAYRRDPQGAFSAVPVKLGQSTAGLVTIESGLAEGDVVALREPGKEASALLPRSAPTGKARPEKGRPR
jgi:multidrug efflux pump subunit AcrA (membrane-fusion protein)